VAYIQHQYNMVLARGADNSISLYDTTQPPDRNDGIEFFERLLKMDGHEHAGYGMDWNQHKEAVAITSSFDGCVCVWDISSATKLDRLVRPVSKFTMLGGNYVVAAEQDVKWHKKDPHLFCCSSSDGDLFLYARLTSFDSRSLHKAHIVNSVDRSGCVQSKIDMNTLDPTKILASTRTGTHVYDIRNMNKRVFTLNNGLGTPSQCKWSPHRDHVYAACFAERQVAVTDMGEVDRYSTNDLEHVEKSMIVAAAE
jgi:histone-binding protein RBBP4